MSKYIDVDKIITFLEKEKAEHIIGGDYSDGVLDTCDNILAFINSIQKETSEISLEKFTEKIEDRKARYNHPDNIPIKAAIAFTARMFYMYPNVAREWYDSLPKVTLD